MILVLGSDRASVGIVSIMRPTGAWKDTLIFFKHKTPRLFLEYENHCGCSHKYNFDHKNYISQCTTSAKLCNNWN